MPDNKSSVFVDFHRKPIDAERKELVVIYNIIDPLTSDV